MDKLRYAMVGGGQGAFIGGVHRRAMALDGQMQLVAGALSSSPEKALASGRELGLADDRNHPSWQALLEDELRRPAGERLGHRVVHVVGRDDADEVDAFAGRAAQYYFPDSPF